MPLDPRIGDAIRAATSEAGQAPDLGARILSWLQALAEGRESFTDRDGTHRRISSLFDAVEVEADPPDEEP